MLRIEYLATGNELLDGSTTDRHTQTLAEMLRPMGLKVQRTVVVPDNSEEISRALRDAGTRADVVIVSGGLGPTTDDITLDTAAETFGSRMIFSREAKRNVLDRMRFLKRKVLNSGQTKQMSIPAGAKVLRNKEGTAPAVSWTLGDRQYFFLPGVPREFRYVLQTHLHSWFEKRRQKSGQYLFVFKIYGWAESVLNEMMKKAPVPKGVEVGYRTTLPENHIKLLVSAGSQKDAERKIAPMQKFLRKKLGAALFSEDQKSFEEVFLEKFRKKKLKFAVAESCTGGLLASMLTRIPGSSDVFDRGFVTYSNQAKVDLLGVSPEILKKYGAVSEETAREMAKGALKNSLADIAGAITGIAGPAGGSSKKPVGTVWMAITNGRVTEAKKFYFPYSREMVQKFSAYALAAWGMTFIPQKSR